MIRALITLALIALPQTAFAHATPVEMLPASGAELADSPKTISIRFSERLEQGSSRIRVAQAGEEPFTTAMAQVDAENPHVLHLQLPPLEEGAYAVSWSVVSKDDGHFTKGAYAFSIGSSSIALPKEDSTVVQINSVAEASLMFVEFVGNSILWGVLIVGLYFARPLFRSRSSESMRIRAYSLWAIAAGVVLGISGAALHAGWKARELAALNAEPFGNALSLYLSTDAGYAALMRMGSLAVLFALFALLSKRLYAKPGASVLDAVVFLPLLSFAYFRATVSHATANPFFPEISIAVNFLHLIEKDLWLGVLSVLVALSVTPLRATLLPQIMPRAFSLLLLNLAGIALTASYIIWLHLKSFKNLTTTLWGETVVTLLAVAGVLVVLRTLNSLALRHMPNHVRYLPFTISAETVAAAGVVFLSSMMIITSPPLHGEYPGAKVARDRGVEFTLEPSPYEKGKALLSILGATSTPVVQLGEDDVIIAPLEKRFEGGYVMPLQLFSTTTLVRISVRQDGGYDARARFEAGPLDPHTGERSFDRFTGGMIVLALLGVAYAILVHSQLRFAQEPKPFARSYLLVVGGFVFGGVIVFQALNAAEAAYGNAFKRTCLADGNAWHLMLPTKADVPVSDTPQEGCMAINGAYHISDPREYEYLRALPEAAVALKRENFTAGSHSMIEVSLLEPGGEPAKLGVEHEKILHLIVIGKDMASFAHLHPEDHASPSKGTFRVPYVFPSAGTYVIALDYLHGLKHVSKTFEVEVGGKTKQGDTARYPSTMQAGDLSVAFDYVPPLAGDIALLRFTATENGKPVTDFEPYLAAAMHLAIVSNDLKTFMHTHGEVHPPGYVAPATLSHNHAPPPPRFGPTIEAHVKFPGPGLYTVFGELKRNGEVVPVRYTVRVEE